MMIRARLMIEVGSLHVILAWSRRPFFDNEKENDEQDTAVDKDDDDDIMN